MEMHSLFTPSLLLSNGRMRTAKSARSQPLPSWEAFFLHTFVLWLHARVHLTNIYGAHFHISFLFSFFFHSFSLFFRFFLDRSCNKNYDYSLWICFFYETESFERPFHFSNVKYECMRHGRCSFSFRTTMTTTTMCISDWMWWECVYECECRVFNGAHTFFPQTFAVQICIFIIYRCKALFWINIVVQQRVSAVDISLTFFPVCPMLSRPYFVLFYQFCSAFSMQFFISRTLTHTHTPSLYKGLDHIIMIEQMKNEGMCARFGYSLLALRTRQIFVKRNTKNEREQMKREWNHAI